MEIKEFLCKVVYLVLLAAALLNGIAVYAAENALLTPQASIGITVNSTKVLLIKKPVANSPSAKAGLRPGDILLSINKHKVSSANELRTAVSKVRPGQLVDMAIVRYNSEQRSYEFREGTIEAEARPASSTSSQNGASIGLELNNTELFAVNELLPDSPSAKVGMRPGDILLSLNKYKVSSTTELRTAMLMVKPGQSVEVEFLGYDAEQQSYEFHNSIVETMKRPASAASIPPETLTLADLAKQPGRWPATVTLEKNVTLPNGETALAGQKFRVAAFEDANQNLTLEDNLQTLSIAPQDSDFLQAANATWAALTPSQRAIDLATLISDVSLWPIHVTTRRLLKSMRVCAQRE